MLLQEVRFERTRISVWVLRFNDQHGRPVREVVGNDRNEAQARLARRLTEIRSGTYLHPEDRLQLFEQRRGRPLSESAKRFFMTLARGPETAHRWLLLHNIFGAIHIPPIDELDRI